MSHAAGGGGEYRSRIGVIPLELGPGPSPRELLGALGDALVRSELVAGSIELHPHADGFVVRATCPVSDELTLIRALRTLIRSSAPDAAEPRDPRYRRRQCALAG